MTRISHTTSKEKKGVSTQIQATQHQKSQKITVEKKKETSKDNTFETIKKAKRKDNNKIKVKKKKKGASRTLLFLAFSSKSQSYFPLKPVGFNPKIKPK